MPLAGTNKGRTGSQFAEISIWFCPVLGGPCPLVGLPSVQESWRSVAPECQFRHPGTSIAPLHGVRTTVTTILCDGDDQGAPTPTADPRTSPGGPVLGFSLRTIKQSINANIISSAIQPSNRSLLCLSLRPGRQMLGLLFNPAGKIRLALAARRDRQASTVDNSRLASHNISQIPHRNDEVHPNKTCHAPTRGDWVSAQCSQCCHFARLVSISKTSIFLSGWYGFN